MTPVKPTVQQVALQFRSVHLVAHHRLDEAATTLGDSVFGSGGSSSSSSRSRRRSRRSTVVVLVAVAEKITSAVAAALVAVPVLVLAIVAVGSLGYPCQEQQRPQILVSKVFPFFGSACTLQAHKELVSLILVPSKLLFKVGQKSFLGKKYLWKKTWHYQSNGWTPNRTRIAISALSSFFLLQRIQIVPPVSWSCKAQHISYFQHFMGFWKFNNHHAIFEIETITTPIRSFRNPSSKAPRGYKGLYLHQRWREKLGKRWGNFSLFLLPHFTFFVEKLMMQTNNKHHKPP